MTINDIAIDIYYMRRTRSLLSIAEVIVGCEDVHETKSRNMGNCGGHGRKTKVSAEKVPLYRSDIAE